MLNCEKRLAALSHYGPGGQPSFVGGKRICGNVASALPPHLFSAVSSFSEPRSETFGVVYCLTIV